ncbi:hypothetical protein ES703_124459 [subsurface metagenome]
MPQPVVSLQVTEFTGGWEVMIILRIVARLVCRHIQAMNFLIMSQVVPQLLTQMIILEKDLFLVTTIAIV